MCYLDSLKPACTLLYLPTYNTTTVCAHADPGTYGASDPVRTDAYHLSNARANVFSPLKPVLFIIFFLHKFNGLLFSRLYIVGCQNTHKNVIGDQAITIIIYDIRALRVNEVNHR